MADQLTFRRGTPGAGRLNDTLRANLVLRKAYLLLAASLLCTSGMAWLSMHLDLPYPGIWVALLGGIGLLMTIMFAKDGPLAILLVFVWTTFEGYTAGPVLSHYIKFVPDGANIIMAAFGITGGTFLGLSAFVLATGARFQAIGNFLFAGLLVALLLSIVSIFIHFSALSLTIAAIMAVVSVGYILYDTGEIVNGGEISYVQATVRLYLDLLNLFWSVLRLLTKW